MSKEEVKALKICCVLVAFTLALSVGWWVLRSSFEASAYNRATGSNVSTWDALWIELRVQAEPKK